jgi:hypothetical protein
VHLISDTTTFSPQERITKPLANALQPPTINQIPLFVASRHEADEYRRQSHELERHGTPEQQIHPANGLFVLIVAHDQLRLLYKGSAPANNHNAMRV